jgi:hypothetical protein
VVQENDAFHLFLEILTRREVQSKPMQKHCIISQLFGFTKTSRNFFNVLCNFSLSFSAVLLKCIGD